MGEVRISKGQRMKKMVTKKCLNDANLYSDSHKLTKKKREKSSVFHLDE